MLVRRALEMDCPSDASLINYLCCVNEQLADIKAMLDRQPAPEPTPIWRLAIDTQPRSPAYNMATGHIELTFSLEIVFDAPHPAASLGTADLDNLMLQRAAAFALDSARSHGGLKYTFAETWSVESIEIMAQPCPIEDEWWDRADADEVRPWCATRQLPAPSPGRFTRPSFAPSS